MCVLLCALSSEGTAQFPQIELIQRTNFESGNGSYEIIFESDQSVLLEQIGQTATLSAVIVDSRGQTVHLPLSWELEANPFVSLLGSNDHSALVQLNGMGVATVQLTASSIDLGISANAPIVLADLAPDAMYVSSKDVISNDQGSMMVVLRRTAATELIQIGDVILSGDRAGVLVRVLGVSLTPEEVILSVEPAAITDALENADINAGTPPQEFHVRFDGARKRLTVMKDGEVIRGDAEPTSNLECKFEDESDFGLEVEDGTIDWAFTTSLGARLKIVAGEVQEFSLAITESLDLNATTGSLEFSSVLAGTATCELELNPIQPPAVPVNVFSFNFRLNPRLGVEVSGSTSGPSFSIVGPTGSLEGSATAGIRYLGATGWEPVGEVSWGGEVSPLTAEFDTGISFQLGASPYGTLGVSIDAHLGRPPFSLTLASLEFAELRAAATLDASLSSPFDPVDRDYTGPTWNAGGSLTGTWKADVSDGALNTLLERLDLPTELPITGNVFAPLEFDFDHSPQISLALTCVPSCPLNYFNADFVEMELTTADGEGGWVSFMASVDGSASLVPLAGAPLSNGLSTGFWDPAPGDDGTYDVFPRLESDALSAVFPYAPAGFETFSVGDPTHWEFQLSPQATFIRADAGDTISGPIVIDLGSLGIVPGQVIGLSSSGFYVWGIGQADEARSTNMVFSTSSELLPYTELNRVPGAIPATMPAIFTTNTCYLPAGQTTDIGEDFAINVPEIVTVPAGAAFLFIGTYDCAYWDNSDPNGDLKVTIDYFPD